MEEIKKQLANTLIVNNIDNLELKKSDKSHKRGSLFENQDSDDLKLESKMFYDAQRRYIELNDIKYSKSKHYICQPFLQTICEVYQHIFLNKEEKTKENLKIEWLFGKAMDIMIRHNITDKKFINYNNETKGCFYNNAMYRIMKYTINTYKADKSSAFIYFTSTIRNSFKEEINHHKKYQDTAKMLNVHKGLEAGMNNISVEHIIDLEKDYDIEYDVNIKDEVPMFITDIIEKYNSLETKTIVLNPNEPRFKRKKLNIPYFLPIGDKGIAFKYINIFDTNEDNGQSRSDLQDEILTIRKHGYQVFYLFSDIYLDEDLDDNVIYNKINNMITSIKNNDLFSSGKDLMIDYIPLDIIENSKINKADWFILDSKKEKREVPIKIEEEYYKYLKHNDKKVSRVYNAGTVDLINI